MNTDKTEKFEVSLGYINEQVKYAKKQIRKEARGSGFEPLFINVLIGVNADEQPYVQVRYTINGSTQCHNTAI
jgi:hypothetical protein